MIPYRVVQVGTFLGSDPAIVFLTGRTFSSVPPGQPPSEPAQTLLRFPGANTVSDVVSGGGAIAPSVPVQLLFWGVYWYDRPAIVDTLVAKVQDLLSGPYTSALDQYGVTPPTYLGYRVVVEWPPPTDPYSCADVSDLVWNLIDVGIFPDPDDPGGRNAYVAFMPPGTTPASPTASGAHAEYAHFDLPFDIDKVWVAYVDFGRNGPGDVDTMTRAFAHELVELATDPEQDGWRSASIGHDGGEIGDVCQQNGNNKTAWVGDVQVPAYWSARDNVCVIPTYPLSVRLDGEVALRQKSLVAEGDVSYPMGAPGRGLCSVLPPCCFKGPYHWQRFQRRESTTVRLTATGYHSPQVTWTCGGQTVSGSGSVNVQVEVTRESPNGVTTNLTTVALDYEVLPPGLFLANNDMVGNFDVRVSVAVSEQDAPGGTGADRTATVVVPFIGYEFNWDEQFQQDEQACDKARSDFWKATNPANRTQTPVPIPDPQPMPAWVSARNVRLVNAAFVETALMRAIDPPAAEELLTTLLRRIGVPTGKSVSPGQTVHGDGTSRPAGAQL